MQEQALLLKLFHGSDPADRCSTIGAFALRDGLTVLHEALNGILHNFLCFAFDAIRFDSHYHVPLCRTYRTRGSSQLHLNQRFRRSILKTDYRPNMLPSYYRPDSCYIFFNNSMMNPTLASSVLPSTPSRTSSGSPIFAGFAVSIPDRWID